MNADEPRDGEELPETPDSKPVGDEPERVTSLPHPGLRILDQGELEDEETDDFDDSPRTVLITGASGNIGRKLREAFGDLYDFVLLDKSADADDPDVIVADLADWDETWVSHFTDVDTVIHLAGNPNEFSSWDELVRPNLDALANVLNAAAYGGVERVIFASSNHAMGGYENFGDLPITVDLAPRPDSPYGGLKLVGERMGKSLAAAFDLTFIAIRLGWIQSGENRPETLPNDWARLMWLSNEDLVNLFENAIESDLGDRNFLVVNGMSNNGGMRWDLTEAVEWLGYDPAGDSGEDIL